MTVDITANQQKAAALYLSLALGAIEAVKEMETPKSARWNRLEGTIPAINRALDMYRLKAFAKGDMDNACAVLDVINDKVREFYP